MRKAALECSLHYQEVYLNTDFLEEAVAKAEVFFRLVVVPDLITGNVEKAMQDGTAMTKTSHADDSTEKTQPDFPCGKCGQIGFLSICLSVSVSVSVCLSIYLSCSGTIERSEEGLASFDKARAGKFRHSQ